MVRLEVACITKYDKKLTHSPSDMLTTKAQGLAAMMEKAPLSTIFLPSNTQDASANQSAVAGASTYL